MSDGSLRMGDTAQSITCRKSDESARKSTASVKSGSSSVAEARKLSASGSGGLLSRSDETDVAFPPSPSSQISREAVMTESRSLHSLRGLGVIASVSRSLTQKGKGVPKRRREEDKKVSEVLNGINTLFTRRQSGSFQGNGETAATEAGARTSHSEGKTADDGFSTALVEGTNFTIFQEEGTPPSFGVINFLSPLAVGLDQLRMVGATWTAVFTPIALSFYDVYNRFLGRAGVQATEVFVDVIFILGFLLALITSVGNVTTGREYLSLPVILRKRLRSLCFWLDFVSTLPFLLGIFAGEATHPSTLFFRNLQVLKLARIHWILVMPASHFETRFFSHFQVLRMLLWLVLSMHAFSCLWYATVVAGGTMDLHFEQLADPPNELTYYVLAFKYGCYIITGKPVDTYSNGELIVLAISAPVGGIFFAFIYGNTTMLLTRINITMNKHHKHIAVIHKTLENLDIPPDLHFRITKYHHFLAVHHNTNAYQVLMQGLSVNLFIELRAHLFKRLFSEGPMFEGTPPNFARRLLQIMVEVTYCPGDIVIRCGDLGNEMYFVVKGRLEVLNDQNEILGKIGENQYFGEVALLISTPRLVTIRAATYCLLAMIAREHFLPIMEDHPIVKTRMMDTMKQYQIKPVDMEDVCEQSSNSLMDKEKSERSNRRSSRSSKRHSQEDPPWGPSVTKIQVLHIDANRSGAMVEEEEESLEPTSRRCSEKEDSRRQSLSQASDNGGRVSPTGGAWSSETERGRLHKGNGLLGYGGPGPSFGGSSPRVSILRHRNSLLSGRDRTMGGAPTGGQLCSSLNVSVAPASNHDSLYSRLTELEETMANTVEEAEERLTSKLERLESLLEARGLEAKVDSLSDRLARLEGRSSTKEDVSSRFGTKEEASPKSKSSCG